MTASHRRPLLAFAGVTLLCALMVGNGMELRIVRAPEANLSAVAGASDPDTAAGSRTAPVVTPQSATAQTVLKGQPVIRPVSDSSVTSGDNVFTQPVAEPAVEGPPLPHGTDGGRDNEGASQAPAAPPSSPAPSQPPSADPSPSDDDSPSDDGSDIPETEDDDVLTFDDIIDPGAPGSESGLSDQRAAPGSGQSTNVAVPDAGAPGDAPSHSNAAEPGNAVSGEVSANTE